VPDDIPSFSEYTASLGRLAMPADPTVVSAEAAGIKEAAAQLADLPEITTESLAKWVTEHPHSANVLGLAVGLSQEKFKNTLKDQLNTQGWVTLSRERPADLVEMLDQEFDLVRLLTVQRERTYDFGDILATRDLTRQTANSARASGRKIEDAIEAIVRDDLGLPCEMRTRFVGRHGRDAPCDLVIPDGKHAEIAVAAKGNDSTGSKQDDAVREIQEMADVRQPRQYLIAIVDGIGWKSRIGDLRKIYNLWKTHQIDGMYTLATLASFRSDVEEAARLRGLLSAAERQMAERIEAERSAAD
jgi:hypothetical protein